MRLSESISTRNMKHYLNAQPTANSAAFYDKCRWTVYGTPNWSDFEGDANVCAYCNYIDIVRNSDLCTTIKQIGLG